MKYYGWISYDVLAFESMDEILQSDQLLNETSSVKLSCSTACYVVHGDQF